jgi:3-hydroxyisobutyrate dehydrogenase-like beta-hydroxyacid dehydrogenase
VTDKQESIINQGTTRIGFIGLGLMGSRLTRRLHSSGWNVKAWNRSPGPARSLARDGIAISSSVANLVADSDLVLSSLANDAAVHSVFFDDGGVFSSAKPGTVILEMSTISPELSRLLHREASSRDLHLLDVAISGSTPAVEAGTVTLLAGGDQTTFEKCTSIYERIAKQWFLIGPGSSGIQMKLVVNLLLGVDMQAIAEAVSLGEHRIDGNVLLNVLSKTTVIPPAFGGKIQKNQEQRLFSGISAATDEQGHGFGYGCSKDFGRRVARGQSGPIGALLQPLLKWRSGFVCNNAVHDQSTNQDLGCRCDALHPGRIGQSFRGQTRTCLGS